MQQPLSPNQSLSDTSEGTTNPKLAKIRDLLEQRGYLTINQLVVYLKDYPMRAVSFPAIRRYINQGHIRCERIGGQFRIPRSSIDHYIKHGTSKIPGTIRLDDTTIEGAQMPSPSSSSAPPTQNTRDQRAPEIDATYHPDTGVDLPWNQIKQPKTKTKTKNKNKEPS